MLRSLWVATTESLQRLRLLGQQQPRLELAWTTTTGEACGRPSSSSRLWDDLSSAFWFAVPKKRRSHHKIRLRTTVQNRIKLRENIITDPRTGELTLQHRLPYNWSDYLPPPPKVELSVYKKLRRQRYLQEEDDDKEYEKGDSKGNKN